MFDFFIQLITIFHKFLRGNNAELNTYEIICDKDIFAIKFSYYIHYILQIKFHLF